jgi:uncharacterized phage protein gp47/JayE
MTRIRTQSEIILSLLDYYRSAQPNLDTKPGTVSRDLLVDAFALQLSRLYEDLQKVSSLQSLRLAIGNDLDKYGANFGINRKKGSKSTGTALITFPSISSDISIPAGTHVEAKNGAAFRVINNVVLSPVYASSYRSIASSYKSELESLNITDQYAYELNVEAIATGIQGNISKYSLVSIDIPGITNTTNMQPFSGGTLSEDDSVYKNRILSVFSGANTGTAVGYRNAALSDSSVLDAIVIEPGDPLMIRDGTVVSNIDGEDVVISEGTGGKIDIYIYGVRLQEILDTYIYRDLSNTGDATNSLNDYVLGQITSDFGKTVTKKRLENIKNGELPNQPVNNLISVSGSLSGNNFIEKSVDEYGRVSGNYELIKDTGSYAGSPWGFDRLHWISNQVSDYQEDKTKTKFNGQDSLTYSDVLSINTITERIRTNNENSRILKSDRSIILLSHTPVISVSRVFNLTTGERYVVEDQNPDGDTALNTTGRIKISGSSLPAVSDVLQVDYVWLHTFDSNYDYDNKKTSNNYRIVNDSIDWGYSNLVRDEDATLQADGSYLSFSVNHPITEGGVLFVNKYQEETATVSQYQNRKIINTTIPIKNIHSIYKLSSNLEIWNTDKADGTFNNTLVYLPTDVKIDNGENVNIIYNTIDVFNKDGYEGNSDGYKITIVPSDDAYAGDLVKVSYISDVNVLASEISLSDLPIYSRPESRINNTFNTKTLTNVGIQPTTHLYSSPGVIYKNLRLSPSKLKIAITNGIISPGTITVIGTSINYIDKSVIPSVGNSLKIDLSQSIKTFLGLKSIDLIPSNIYISKVVSVEKVDTISGQVLSVLNNYDLTGYKLKNNSFVIGYAESDNNLTNYEVLLPETLSNISNIPNIGQYLRISFYIATKTDNENIYFSKSETLFTNKTYFTVDSISVSSGFSSTSSSSTLISVYNYNQPQQSTRYKASYDYKAPKVNERINIRYNHNRLINDSTFNVESTRPISADVLVKAGSVVLVDISLAIVLQQAFINNSSTVVQNVQDAITSALNATQFGTTVDQSDLIAVAQGVEGVDRVRITHFNYTNTIGSVLSITAKRNEYISSNEVSVVIEDR